MNYVYKVLVICFFCSCNRNEKINHKLLIEQDRNGKTISKAPYYISDKGDTLIDGMVVYYYPNGIVQDSFRVVNGLKNGTYYSYNETGSLKSVMNFENNRLNGFSYTYFANGNLEAEQLTNNDSILYSKNYFPNGQLKSYFIFLNNKESKYFLIYDSSGKKIDEGGDSIKAKQWK